MPDCPIIDVLLIDEELLFREALRGLFESVDDIKVVATAQTAAEAVEIAQLRQPRLVLFDVPHGLGMLARIAQIVRVCPEAKFVVLDDGPCDVNVREALRMNADGYLTKRQPFEEIVDALRRIGRGERVFAPEIAYRLALSCDGLRLIGGRDAGAAMLTAREIDVLVHLAQGHTVSQCAGLLGISASTVENHRSRMMKKLNLHKTVMLAQFAIREGLVSVDGPISPCPDAGLV